MACPVAAGPGQRDSFATGRPKTAATASPSRHVADSPTRIGSHLAYAANRSSETARSALPSWSGANYVNLIDDDMLDAPREWANQLDFDS